MQHPFGWLLIALSSCAAYAAGPLDRYPPELSVDGPDDPVRGVVQIPVLAADPQGVALSARIDGGEPVPIGAVLSLDTRGLADGEHTVTVTATDRSLRENQTVRSVSVRVDNTPPRLAVHVTPLAQGLTGAVFVATDEPAAVSAEVLGDERPLYAVGERRWRALVGIAASRVAGIGRVAVRAIDRAGNVGRLSQAVEVEATAFANGGFIDIAPDPDPDPEWLAHLEQTRAERADAMRRTSAVQRWTGPLLRPVDGRRTSPYGKLRTYVGGLVKHHEGVDYADPVGSPVVASAAGEVVLAREEPVYGKTVIVDHGQGLSTSYNHLSSLEVTAGDRVAPGQAVGTLGSTGFSTGPHLHWGLSVHGVEVDAEQWLATGFELDGAIEASLASALSPATASR